jgi:hypothetical protein
MVKKRMAMKMVTIFVALIVCGMFFPGLARGEDLNVDTELREGVNTELDLDIGNVVLGEGQITTVGISNQSSETTYTLILALNKAAACTTEFEYTGPNVESGFEPGETLNVQVTYTPTVLGPCTAWLSIMYIGSLGGEVKINFTGNGIEEASDTFGPIDIGGFPTSVMNRLIEIDEHTTSTLEEMIDHCEDKFESSGQRRGKLVRCIAWTTGELCRAGDITKKEKRELRRFAARLEWQTIIEKMKARRKSGESSRGNRRFWWCRRH